MIERRRYKEWEMQRIRHLFGKVEIKIIAERLQRSEKSIADKSRKMGLRTPMVRPGWTAEDEWRLNQLKASGKTALEIAALMGRSKNSIIGKEWRRKRDEARKSEYV